MAVVDIDLWAGEKERERERKPKPPRTKYSFVIRYHNLYCEKNSKN